MNTSNVKKPKASSLVELKKLPMKALAAPGKPKVSIQMLQEQKASLMMENEDLKSMLKSVNEKLKAAAVANDTQVVALQSFYCGFKRPIFVPELDVDAVEWPVKIPDKPPTFRCECNGWFLNKPSYLDHKKTCPEYREHLAEVIAKSMLTKKK